MRLKRLVVIVVCGFVLTGAATAARHQAALGPSVDQAFIVCAPPWPGDPGFVQSVPPWPGDPGFVATVPAVVGMPDQSLEAPPSCQDLTVQP